MKWTAATPTTGFPPRPCCAAATLPGSGLNDYCGFLAMTKSTHMSEVQWARLAEDANYGVRRGAWYRVAELTPSDAVVDVNRKPVALPRGAVKLRTPPPKSWRTVPRPPDARPHPQNSADKDAGPPS